jgi:hypothetical protein
MEFIINITLYKYVQAYEYKIPAWVLNSAGTAVMCVILVQTVRPSNSFFRGLLLSIFLYILNKVFSEYGYFNNS